MLVNALVIVLIDERLESSWRFYGTEAGETEYRAGGKRFESS